MLTFSFVHPIPISSSKPLGFATCSKPYHPIALTAELANSKPFSAAIPAQTQPRSLPQYQVTPAPHLSDYLGELPALPSPLLTKRSINTFTKPGQVVLAEVAFDSLQEDLSSRVFTAFQKAGPRENVVYGPGARVAIVSCGGICPGINTVIRELVSCLHQYGVSKIFGVPHGYRGFYSLPWRELTIDDVEEMHKVGGSMLGSSRGGFDLTKIVDAVETRKIDQVYVIGGDGTIMGCQLLYQEVQRRRLKTAVVSVPKTIDNDIAIIDKSFGFETAVDEAQRAIGAAYVEALAFPDCVSVVKLMGRNSGFIACHASLASHEVDCCLIPEEDFALRGNGGVLEFVAQRLNEKGRCVLVVAEGAGHERYGNVDIGRHVMSEIKSYFEESGREISTKYLDPTYQIRAVPTTTQDNLLCTLMAHAAVHGAYAGFTGYSAGSVNGSNVMLPLNLLAGVQKKLDPSAGMWQRLRMATEQPEWTT